MFLLFLSGGSGARCVSFSLEKSLPVAEKNVVSGCRLFAVVPGRFIGWAERDQL